MLDPLLLDEIRDRQVVLLAHMMKAQAETKGRSASAENFLGEAEEALRRGTDALREHRRREP